MRRLRKGRSDPDQTSQLVQDLLPSHQVPVAAVEVVGVADGVLTP